MLRELGRCQQDRTLKEIKTQLTALKEARTNLLDLKIKPNEHYSIQILIAEKDLEYKSFQSQLDKNITMLESLAHQIEAEYEKQLYLQKKLEEIKMNLYQMICEMGAAFLNYVQTYSVPQKSDPAYKSQIQLFLMCAFDEIFQQFFEPVSLSSFGIPRRNLKRVELFSNKKMADIRHILTTIYDKSSKSIINMKIDPARITDEKQIQEAIRTHINFANNKVEEVFKAKLNQLVEQYDQDFKLKSKITLSNIHNHPLLQLHEDFAIDIPNCSQLFRQNKMILQNAEGFRCTLDKSYYANAEASEKLMAAINKHQQEFVAEVEATILDLMNSAENLRLALEDKSTKFSVKRAAEKAWEVTKTKVTQLLNAKKDSFLRENFKLGRDRYQGSCFSEQVEDKVVACVTQSIDKLEKSSRRACASLGNVVDELSLFQKNAKELQNQIAMQRLLRFLKEDLFSENNLIGFLQNQTKTFFCLGGVKVRLQNSSVRLPTGLGLIYLELKHQPIEQLNGSQFKKVIDFINEAVQTRKKYLRGRTTATDQLLDAILQITNKIDINNCDVESFKKMVSSITDADGDNLSFEKIPRSDSNIFSRSNSNLSL